MTNPRIAINCRFLSQPTTGVQRFAASICVELKKIFPEAFFLAPSNVLDSASCELLGAKIIGNFKGHLWEQVDLPFFLRKTGSPLLINLANTGPLFYKNSIFTLHDVAFLRYPDNFSIPFRLFYKFMAPRLLWNSRVSITVSEFSKREISSRYSVGGRGLKVVYNAVDERFSPQPASGGDKPYLLAVSSPNMYKNFARVIKAYSRWEGRSQTDLYIVGSASSPAFSKQHFGLVPEGVRFLGRVNDEELISFYSNAFGFVFPSLYEGFGIPPLEAQACGCPVIASKAASIPEILGDSVLYFDPLDDDDILLAMDKLCSLSTEERSELINKGYVNAGRYSWERSAINLAQIIKAQLAI